MAGLHAMREQVPAGPSAAATEAQHAKGELTARERCSLRMLRKEHADLPARKRGNPPQ